MPFCCRLFFNKYLSILKKKYSCGAETPESTMEQTIGRARVQNPYLNEQGCNCVLVRASRKEHSWLELLSQNKDSHESITQDLDYRLRSEGARMNEIIGKGRLIIDYEKRIITTMMQTLEDLTHQTKEILQNAYPGYTINTTLKIH